MTSVPARRQTRLLDVTVAGIAEAGAILRAGGLVAFPTETVYGLGAHALDPRAVRGIFEAKQRPSDDPLIVHVAHAALVDEVALPGPLAQQLAEHFWPGPLTLVLPKRPRVPAEVTAGLETVAVRVPAHPIARALLVEAGLPVAAPSANLFGRPSPTLAEHVLHDLRDRIDAVLDGGRTTVGVESTIVDVSGPRPRLLRPGGLAVEEIEAFLGLRLLLPPARTAGPQASPGLMPVHYSPRTPLVLIVGEPGAAQARLRTEVEAAVAAGQNVGVLLLENDVDAFPLGVVTGAVGTWSDPSVSAARLFEAIRSLDAANLDVLFARDLADVSIGLGRALADRLRRAARRIVDSHDENPRRLVDIRD
jgi:L-threonylcarbamoyladenylate synthase